MGETLSAEYAAGFFDGEGSVYAAVRKGKVTRRPSPTVLVCITNTNRAVLDAHKDQWGGSIATRKPQERRLPTHQWVLCGKMGEPYLRAILPHLIVKAPVVAAALEMRELQSIPAAERIDYAGDRRAKPEYLAKVWEVHSRIRALNTQDAPFNVRREYQ
jgi:hypothetical protein